MAETKTQRSGILVILTALFAAFCGLWLLIGGVCYCFLGDAFGNSMTAAEVGEAKQIFLLLLLNITNSIN